MNHEDEEDDDWTPINPVKGQPVLPIEDGKGASELPSTTYVLTARGKHRAARFQLDTMLRSLDEVAENADKRSVRRIRNVQAWLVLLKHEKAKDFQLGRDSVLVAPNVRYCPKCLLEGKKTPLPKNKQLCEPHRALYRKLSNRFAKQKQRAKAANVQQCQQKNT